MSRPLISPLPARAARVALCAIGVLAALPAAAGAAGTDIRDVRLLSGPVAHPGDPVVVEVERADPGPAEPPLDELDRNVVIVTAKPPEASCGDKYNAGGVAQGTASPPLGDRTTTFRVTFAAPEPGTYHLCTRITEGPSVGFFGSTPIQPALTVEAPPTTTPPTTTPPTTMTPPATPGSCDVAPRLVRRAKITVRCRGVRGVVDLRLRRDGRTRHVARTLVDGRLRASPTKLGLRRGVTRISVYQGDTRLGWAMVRRR